MKKKLAWLCLLVSPLVLGGAVFCLADRDPISQGNCDRIMKGMTEKEVNAILGGQKGSAAAAFRGFFLLGSRGIINTFMEFDDAQNLIVDRAEYIPYPPKSIFERIRDWIGL